MGSAFHVLQIIRREGDQFISHTLYYISVFHIRVYYICVKNWRKVITSKDFIKLCHERQRSRLMILYVTRDDKLHNSNDVPSFKLETFDLQTQQFCLIAKFSSATVTKKHSFHMVNCFKVHGSCKGSLNVIP
jgi:hypothetical protein